MNTITQADILSIKQLETDGNTIEQICRFTGRSNDIVDTILRGHHALQRPARPITKKAIQLKTRNAIVAIVGERAQKSVARGASFLPTPQQIAAACQVIRDAWSEAERYNRYEITPGAVRNPVAPPASLSDYE